MSDFETVISEANKACESISSLYFRPSGIFANSIVRNHEITNLITDLNIDLRTSDSSPHAFLEYDESRKVLRRYDGAEFYEDESIYYSDVSNIETFNKTNSRPVLQELSMANNYLHLNKLEQLNGQIQGMVQKRLTGSRFKVQVDDGENSSSSQSDDEEESNLINSVEEILMELNKSYPISNLGEYLEKLKIKNTGLTKELKELSQIAKDIRIQLKRYNIDLNNRDIEQFQKSQGTTTNILEEKKKELIQLQKLKAELENSS